MSDTAFCYRIPVRSSGDEPYTISVQSVAGGVSVSCNCQAGEYGQMCKHKRAVIVGDLDKFAVAEEWGLDPGDYGRARAAMDAAGIPDLFRSTEAEIAALDKEMERLKARKKAIKKALDRKLEDGV